MPIDCPIRLPRLTESEMRHIDYQVMGHAFASQNDLGRLCDESVYQVDLANRLNAVGITAATQVPITLTFRQFTKTVFIDLVVLRQVPYELKAVSQLTSKHENQLLNYLLLTNAHRGKLVNFRTESVESRFVNAPLEAVERRNISVDITQWKGDSGFEELLTALVSDWGTSLDLSLYAQAVTDCLGGKEKVLQKLPLRSSDGPLGNQRFHLVNAQTAFRITTYPHGVQPGQDKQFQKLIKPSPLECLYWVNIARHELRFQTIRNR